VNFTDQLTISQKPMLSAWCLQPVSVICAADKNALALARHVKLRPHAYSVCSARTHAICVVPLLVKAIHSVVKRTESLDLSQNLDVAGLVAFWANCGDKRNALVFRQALEASRLDVLKVCEQIWTACIWSDEAEALSIVEPFDYTCLSAHVNSLKILKIGDIAL
jgi:hypothetical protein